MNQVEIMRAVWEVSGDGIVISGPDTVIREANPAYCAMTGYTEAQLVGKKTNIIASGITPRAVYNEMWEQLRATGRWSGELINRRPDGSLWISAISISAIRWPNGDVAAYVGIARDLTEDRRLREALREQSSRLQGILQALTKGILLFDKNGRCAKANQAASRMLHRTEEELTGATQEELATLFTALFREHLPLQVGAPERILSTRIEPTHFFKANWEPVTTADGAELGKILILADITRETELDRMKEEFIATVSHELRTPLTAMKGSLGLMAGGVLGQMQPMQAELVQIALQNTDRLIRQVSEILTLSKMESGSVQLKLAPVDLNWLAVDVLDELQPVATGRRIRVTTDLADELPPILADGDQMRQVLVNLVGNAYKFTPEGGRVSLQTWFADGAVQLSVSDTGRGIARDQLERIFERFTRAPGERASGTGLGLAIARKIVDAHGGRIWAESVIGEGSAFRVEFPTHE